MWSPPLRRETTCEKHDLVQSGKSSMMSWPDVKLIPQTNKLCQFVCPYVCLFVCPFVCLSVPMSICLSLCLSEFTHPNLPTSSTCFIHTLQHHLHTLPSHFTHTHPHTLPTHFTQTLHQQQHPHTLPSHFTHILYPPTSPSHFTHTHTHTSPTAPT